MKSKCNRVNYRNINDIKTHTYELPDGTTVELGGERCRIPEILFTGNSTNNEKFFGFTGVHQMVTEAITKTDLDIRKDLYANIAVVGGNTLIPGFIERLQKQLYEVCPQNVRVKALANSSTERRFSSWIGGSILSSLGSFQQMWMSKQEYEEHGAIMIERKCP